MPSDECQIRFPQVVYRTGQEEETTSAGVTKLRWFGGFSFAEPTKQSPSTGRLPLNAAYPCFCSLKPSTTETRTKRLLVAVLLHVRQSLFPLNSRRLKAVQAASFGTTAGKPAASMFPRTRPQEKSAGARRYPLTGGSHRHRSTRTQQVRRRQPRQGCAQRPRSELLTQRVTPSLPSFPPTAVQ